MTISASYESEITGSTWECDLNPEYWSFESIWLNGVKVELTERRSEILWNKINKTNDLEMELRTSGSGYSGCYND